MCLFYCFQIPGFYFDPDKNRYFRIVPGYADVISGAVTSKDVALKAKHKQPPALPALDSVKRRRADASQSCFVSCFQNVQIGQVTVRDVRSKMLSGIVRNLAWHNVVPVLPVLEHEEEYRIDQSYVKQIFCTTDENQLICRWCLQHRFDYPCGTTSSVLQRFELSDAAQSSSKHTALQCISVGYHRSAMQFKGIMSACLAPTNILPECHVTPVLYAAALQSRPFLLDTVAVLDSLDGVDQSQTTSNFRTFYVGKKWVWSSAWSLGLNNQFAVGTEKLAFIFNADTGKRFTIDTKSSDVLVLAYTSPVSALFYAVETEFARIFDVLLLCVAVCTICQI